MSESQSHYPSFLGAQSIPAGQSTPGAPDIAWRPSPLYLERSRLRAFINQYGFASFEELLNKAAQSPEWFWGAAVKDLGLEFYTPYEQIMDTSRGWHGPPGSKAANTTT